MCEEVKPGFGTGSYDAIRVDANKVLLKVQRVDLGYELPTVFRLDDNR